MSEGHGEDGVSKDLVSEVHLGDGVSECLVSVGRGRVMGQARVQCPRLTAPKSKSDHEITG